MSADAHRHGDQRRSRRAAPRPYTLVAELTYRCPLACAYCSNPVELAARRDELDTDDWQRVLAEAEALACCRST